MRVIELTITDYPVEPSYGRNVFRVSKVLHSCLLKTEHHSDLSDLVQDMNRQLDRDMAAKPQERPDYDEKTLP